HILTTEVARAAAPGNFRSRDLERATWAISGRGRIEVRHYWMDGPAAAATEPRSWSYEAVANPAFASDRAAVHTVWSEIGFAAGTFSPGGNYFYSRGGRTARAWTLQSPCWFLLMLTALLPVARFVMLYR